MVFADMFYRCLSRAGGQNNVRGGFIPPFVKKAVDASNGGAGAEPSPFSARTMELLAGAH